jgi:hypothetical protein
MPDITNLNRAKFNDPDASLLLTIGDGVSVTNLPT